jgi:hypothetical protein
MIVLVLVREAEAVTSSLALPWSTCSSHDEFQA